ncbi:zinc ribbon domain-containing protein [Candidatus Alkanophaga liquidiphilum]
MIHNFWPSSYLYKRISEKAEEYGIRTRRADERGSTSSKCPRCGGSKHVTKSGRLLNA